MFAVVLTCCQTTLINTCRSLPDNKFTYMYNTIHDTVFKMGAKLKGYKGKVRRVFIHFV